MKASAAPGCTGLSENHDLVTCFSSQFSFPNGKRRFGCFYRDRIVSPHSWPTGGAVSQVCLYENIHLFPICFVPQTMKEVNRGNRTCLSLSENCKQKQNECCLREFFFKCGRNLQTETAPAAAIDRPDWWHVGSKKQTRIWWLEMKLCRQQ